MKAPRAFSLKFLAFALAPTFVLLIGGEIAVRLKYFLAPGHDWSYLTAPFGRPSLETSERAAPARADTSASKADDATESSDQMVFKWQVQCVDQRVYSTELRREMPRTFDEHCFRGDRVTPTKDSSEYRIVFLGGSTVEDAQSDTEMMTAQVKRLLPPTYRGKRVRVVNTGKANFGSRRILAYWDSSVRAFLPDLVVYYEAWNEQEGDVKFLGMHLDQHLAVLRSYRIHRALYYRSMLYTYLVERFGFRLISGERFWKIDVTQLRNFTELARKVRASGSRFVFVTQIVRFPRMWNGIDTFDYHAVDALLDRLRTDHHYVYSVNEISALNQRLAVFYTIELCLQNDIPFINILEPIEALGEAGRADLFMDLGHLTVRGDRTVGQLIAERLNLLD